ncbi:MULTISPECIES: cardiolipin synthase [Curtobacterium]|uniref:Cardiolipin synthase n=2 Tax=Curtobacterium TaxID=2034 RepID=A0A9Q2W0R6_9MICO|nr:MULTISPECIES: cardiolipin synthase [Curtobacterium]EYT64775.1 cardiolipin synthase [Curtobacterium flaccumfaciens UCD-AKU]KQR31515.1 cardiolipin synthase [Curtobacterium sp. Leaf154]MBF4597081.1 cardiolipin synthase [Curtobacterium sp. VKM Ac-1796]MBF4609875.1 cardiolipin synthase [Curtobacterium sp. VKM Ac-2889]MBT1540357.1 cardiolipin synthase [Curtobacterium flaccumfaciens pv. flaccumfaciens]
MEHWLTVVITVLLVLLDLAIRVFSIIYVPINRKPQTATAWLLAIFLIPYIGFIVFLVIGSTKLPRARREKQTEINAYILEQTEGIERVRRDHPWPAWLESVTRLNRELGAMPLVGGNSAELYPDSEESIAEMTRAIDQSRRFVHVEFYIATLDDTTRPFFEALARAQSRGVTVRFLLDHWASRGYPGYKDTLAFMDQAGIEWHLMLPLLPLQGKFQRPDLRNHRKIMVLDGSVAFTGSQNLIDASYDIRSHVEKGMVYKDLFARFEGPVVAGLNALFVTDWYSETDELLLRESDPVQRADRGDALDCQVVPSGPGFDGENNLRLFNALLYSAQQKVSITSPYFVPDDSMLYAITTTAQRGVEVELFVGEMGDHTMTWHAQRSYYEGLLRAGVKIWLYRAPTILHAKHFTIDDEVSVIGSSNMDMRSFSLNLEVSVMVRGHRFVDALREVQEAYKEHSFELTLDEWVDRPRRSKVLDNVARLTAALQ